MEIDFSQLSWVAVLVSVVVGQIVSTLWFVVLFGEPWAREYGVASSKEHTKEVPPYTYAVGIACTAALAISLAVLQGAFGVTGIGGALKLAGFVSVGLCIATGVPGQAFLRRWRVASIACGSQVAMIFAMSVVLVLVG
ncbi:MAG: DUF1761 domain-containing protein [Myxococcota bacterium]